MELLILPQQIRVTLDAGRSLLEAALKARVHLPHSCRGGSCGACRAHLVSGDVHYPQGRTLGLDHAESAAGEILMCQAVALTDVTVEILTIRPTDEAEVKSLPCRVQRLERLSPDVMAVFLRLPAVESFVFRAGQYVDVLLPGHRRRSFSIASPQEETALLELHVRRVEGGVFTTRVFEEFKVGTLLHIEGPLGRFVYAGGREGPLLLVAGGTGFAPLKSMMSMLLKQGITRPIRLYWGVRTAADLYQREWVEAQVRQCPALSFVPVFSGSMDRTSGCRTGLVHEALIADYPDLSAVEVYAAGPPEMIAALASAVSAHGCPREHFHADAFEYAVDSRGVY